MTEQKMKMISTSERRTLAFARRFASTLRGGDIVALVGELGAGKTVFVRGVASYFNIREPIRSPTFTLMHIHRIPQSKVNGKMSNVHHLVHVDAYRMKNARELAAIGIGEYLENKKTITLIEWADRVSALYRRRAHWAVTFRHGRTHPVRRISAVWHHPNASPTRRQSPRRG